MDRNTDDDSTARSNNNNNNGMSVRKRGHQHHIRFTGIRHSNVRADEILAALRNGDQLPIKQTIPIECENQQNNSSDSEMNSTVDTDNNNLTMTHSLFRDRTQRDSSEHLTATNCNENKELNDNDSTNDEMLIDNFNENRRLDSMRKNSNILTNTINRKTDSSASFEQRRLPTKQLTSTLNTDIDMDTKDDQDDSISSGSSCSNNTKSKSKKSKKSLKGIREVDGKREKRSHRTKILPPTERPPLEGADAEHWNECNDLPDIENDPEAADWQKLRCTSERTEVIAEREYRRQNRRCADYPGLAFGRSIFSSDTMMKLQLIRNELHNIMKSQLKRVCVYRRAKSNRVEQTNYGGLSFIDFRIILSEFAIMKA